MEVNFDFHFSQKAPFTCYHSVNITQPEVIIINVIITKIGTIRAKINIDEVWELSGVFIN